MSFSRRERKRVSGILFLHAITAAAPAASSMAGMRAFNEFCRNTRLKDAVVVVTTHWDQVCPDGTPLAGVVESETALIISDGLLRELRDARVPFVRTGHFPYDSNQHLRNTFPSPATIVEHFLIGREENVRSGVGTQVTLNNRGLTLSQEQRVQLVAVLEDELGERPCSEHNFYDDETRVPVLTRQLVQPAIATASAFGENVDRLGSIRSILDNYPFSAGLLREILQNSDDAKATMQVRYPLLFPCNNSDHNDRLFS